MGKYRQILYLIFLLLITVLLGAGYYFSSEIIAFPVRPLSEDQANLKINNLADLGLPTPTDISFQNEDVVLKGWLFRNPRKKSCGVVFLHGHTGTRFAALKYAPLFWTRGCSLFFYDARHHGESGGRFGTFGYFEKFDLSHAIDSFSSLAEIPSSNIGILGESYGAATALQLAEVRKDIAFVIADSPYRDMQSIIEKRAVEIYGLPILIVSSIALQISEFRARFLVKDVSPLHSATKIYFPVFLIHSNTDEFTSFQDSVEIYEAIPSNRKKLLITDWGAKHGSSINVNYKSYSKELDLFLKEFSPKAFSF
jgi:fermentation-respiration switch protein FrsA (DUF1100 family)